MTVISDALFLMLRFRKQVNIPFAFDSTNASFDVGVWSKPSTSALAQTTQNYAKSTASAAEVKKTTAD